MPFLIPVVAAVGAGAGAAALGASTIAAVGIGLATAGTVVSVMGQLKQGKAAKQAAESTAQSQQNIAEAQAKFQERAATITEYQAGQEVAAVHRTYAAEKRAGQVVKSRVQALAAASGAGALDPTVTDILGSIDTEAEFAAMTALYEGDQRAQALREEATSARYEAGLTRATGQATASATRSAGELRQQAARTSALGTLLEGGTSIFSKYQDYFSSRERETIVPAIRKPDRPLSYYYGYR